MENFEIGKNIDRSYYLTGSSDFSRINEIINLMPQFQIKNTETYEYSDTYFETPEYFLKEINASIRIRRLPKKQTLSIVCNKLSERREFEIEMKLDDKINDKDEYILFLEDKIQEIYTHRIDVDVIRLLKSLKPFLVMKTKRTAFKIENNREFLCEVDFDITSLQTKRNVDEIYVVEFKNRCFLTQENEMYFEKFVKEITKKVVMIPMGEKKFDAGKRVFKMDW